MSGVADTQDFSGPTKGTVNFAQGVDSQPITLNVIRDNYYELDENFVITLSNPKSAAIVGASANGTITNDDTGWAISTTDLSKLEGNSGSATRYTYTITRLGVPIAGTVKWSVSGDSSTLDSTDFAGATALPSGSQTFLSSDSAKTFTIDVAGDNSLEANETFKVALTSSTSGSIYAPQASVTSTIVNDDSGLTISATNASRAEGNNVSTPFTFTVTRAGFLDQVSTVTYSVAGSSGNTNSASAEDFTDGVLPTSSLTFGAGESTKTITVNVVGDTDVETDETFTVNLSNPSSGTSIVTAVATGTILNDDALLSISAGAQSQNWEGNSGTTPLTFTVTRSGFLTQTTTVGWSVIGSGTNPANAKDFGGNVITDCP